VADHLCVLLLPVCNAVAPAVMMPELSAAFGLSAMGTASVLVSSITAIRHSVWWRASHSTGGASE